jgi:tetratricopeptide (TPR) repeat protein
LLAVIVGCGNHGASQRDAEHMLVSARDLEEELTDLPRAIARYTEITEQFPGTVAAEKARTRRATLARAQTLLAGREAVSEDSLEAFYVAVVQAAPDYLAVLKRLGTIYYNQTALSAQGAANTGLVAMKENVVEIWKKQDRLWSNYAFRPISSNRFWQDQLCKHALLVTKMLTDGVFREYDRALPVINRGLEYASSVDIISSAKVYAAYCTHRKGKTEDQGQGIALAKEALSYDFLSDNDRARAYHVIGLCYSTIHEDSGDLKDLDEAIKALNESVNIHAGMAPAKELLKVLRQQRERLAVRS